MSYDYEKERKEAVVAGQRALNSLYAARDYLGSARSWGMVDMFMGGFLSTMIKRSKMSDAQRAMEQAKYDLRTFSRELSDIEREVNLNIEADGFLHFADYFFDNFFVDWMVQDRINEARNQVDTAIRRVEEIVDNLNTIWV